MGIIAVPVSAAMQTMEMMVNCGIRGILNFAPLQLKSQEDCRIHNVNIGLEIENLFFMVNQSEKKPFSPDSNDDL